MERQVKKEITVLKSIRHRNVVRMIEVLKSANHIYIVMELICGGELFDRIGTECTIELNILCICCIYTSKLTSTTTTTNSRCQEIR